MKRSLKSPQLKHILFCMICISIFQCQKLKTSLHKNESLILKGNTTYNYFNKKIIDPYQKLEKLEDSLVVDWLNKQDQHHNIIVNHIDGKEKLKTKIKSYNTLGKDHISRLTIAKNGYHFYLKKNHLEKTSKLFYRCSFNEKEHLLYDPSNFNKESGSSYSINFIQPNWDATQIVIGFTKNGEEFSTLAILNVETQKLTKTTLTNTWPSELGGVQWLPNNSGFIYQFIPVIDKSSSDYILNTEAVLFELNNPQEKKTLFSREKHSKFNINEEDFPIIQIKNNEDNYIFCEIGGATPMVDFYFTEMPAKNNFDNLDWKLLFRKEDKVSSFEVKKDELFFLTSKDAPKFKLCKTNLSKPNFKNPEVIIDESNDMVITDFTLTNKGIFLVKTKNGVDAKLFQIVKGKEKEIPLPKPSGEINLTSMGFNQDVLWIEIEGWTSKKERYRYDFITELFVAENLSPIEQYKTLEEVVIEEIEIPSHDGVLVPLSIIYRKGSEKDKKNRLLINAYGSYGWSNSPYLYPYLLHWLDQGGIYAVAHVRGGGEKGEAWHKAGYKTTKPNSWKDLIACTEYFVQNNYTTSDKIAIWGASAGGITIGRAITERPDLFATAIIRVGMLNTLRFEFGPNGKNNIKEFGTVKDSLGFEALQAMDAYHHIKDGVAYPAVYLTTGINDARVPAWVPGKFAARLQEATSSGKPVLLDVDFEGGHGFDALQEKKDEELANILTFALWQTGHPEFQPK